MSIGFGFFPFHSRPQGLKGKNYENKNYSDNSKNPIFLIHKTIRKQRAEKSALCSFKTGITPYTA